jgi:D-beta-D-heptose 7-phosphate kinase/D-beta-D-heptose 1-phosphate adenosyltransferase
MDITAYKNIVGRFTDIRVLVVGDVYLDENVYGVVNGVSLEAPIPILEVHERRYNPGAAGNAACNAAALGAKTSIVGYIGNDINGGILRHEFDVRNVDTAGLVTHPSAATNTYGKWRAGSFNAPAQEILRTDTRKPSFVHDDVEDAIIAAIRERAADVDVIIVVDQVSSVVTDRVIDAIGVAARDHDVLTVGDSRERAGSLRGFDVLVPNDREAGVWAGIDVCDEPSLKQAADALRNVAKNAIITRGPLGITIFDNKGSATNVPLPIKPRQVNDVTGAGDTVTATVALTLAAGGSHHDAATLGNIAASVAVAKPGVVTVSPNELIDQMAGHDSNSKRHTLDELARIVEKLRKTGKRIVWTNGCFDILHVGHIKYLENAAAQGDVLIVGLNTDASVQAIKGPKRPIQSEDERAIVLSALSCVDHIVLFGEFDTTAILDRLQPHIYAKGGDYTLDTINQDERRIIEGYGGHIALLAGVEGKSTTAIIEKMDEES